VGKGGDSIDGFVKSGRWPVDQGVFQNCDFVPDRVDTGEIYLDPDYETGPFSWIRRVYLMKKMTVNF